MVRFCRAQPARPSRALANFEVVCGDSGREQRSSSVPAAPNIHAEDFGLRHLPGVEEVSPPRNKQHGRKHSGAPSTTRKQAASSSCAILDLLHGYGWQAAKPNVTSATRAALKHLATRTSYVPSSRWTPGQNRHPRPPDKPDMPTAFVRSVRVRPLRQTGHAGQMSGVVRSVWLYMPCRLRGGVVFERGTEV